MSEEKTEKKRERLGDRLARAEGVLDEAGVLISSGATWIDYLTKTLIVGLVAGLGYFGYTKFSATEENAKKNIFRK